jgi:PKD repeat protein
MLGGETPADQSNRAQSEVVGVILLVAVVALTISGAGAFYLSNVADAHGPATDVRVTVTADTVTLTHNGGSSLATDSLRVVIRRDGSDTGTDWGDGTVSGDGDDSFEPGEQWRQGGFGFDPDERIELLLVHDPTESLLVGETVNPAVGGGSTPTSSPTSATPSTSTTTSPTPASTSTTPSTPTSTPEPPEPPNAGFDVTPTAPEVDQQATFDAADASDPDGEITSYEWDFGDGTTGTGETATHTYTSAGTYTAELRVTDDDGRTDTTTRTVTVEPRVVTAINAGGTGYESADGVVYSGDPSCTLAGANQYGVGSDTAVANTTDDPLYRTECYGTDFAYEFDVDPGRYRVTVQFAEIYWNNPDRRVFDVDAGGESLATDLDVYDEVGADTALVRGRTVRSTDGTLTVRFHRVDVDNAKVSAVRVERLGPPAQRPPLLTAVQPDPDRMSDSAGEFVRVTVRDPTDTTGWTLVDSDSGQVTRFPDRRLSGDYYFARTPDAFAETWHLNGSRVFELGTLLANGGESLRLRNESGAVVDQFAYERADTASGWSVSVGTGEAAVRKSAGGGYTDTNTADDWRVREENAFHTLEAGPVPAAGVAYVDSTGDNYLEAVDAQGRVAFYDVIDPTVLGPTRADLDGDGLLELPYVGGNGNLRIVDRTGESSVFVDSGAVQSGTTRIGVGDLDGDGTPAVFFRGTSSRISVKEVGGSVRTLSYRDGGSTRDLRGHATAGVAAFSGPPGPKLIYVESRTNDELATFDPDGRGGQGQRKLLGVKPASINAVGSPADYDDDGENEVPYVDGNSDVALADADGRDGGPPLADAGNVSTTAMGRLDVTGDATPEVVFVSNSRLYYVTEGGTIRPLLDRQGRELPASSGSGVA